MQNAPRQTFIRPDGTVDTDRAMARGHDARTVALRTALSSFVAWVRRQRERARPAAPLAPRR